MDDPGDTLCGVRLGFDGVFAALSALTIVLISASCYFEEWMYKALPGFDYFWTVAFAELLVFSVMSIAGAFATGTLGALLRDRKAPSTSTSSKPPSWRCTPPGEDSLQIPQLRHRHRPSLVQARLRHGHQRRVARTEVQRLGNTRARWR